MAVGLKGLVSLSSSIQLSQHATAALTGTWSPDEGVGLQVNRKCMVDDFQGICRTQNLLLIEHTETNKPLSSFLNLQLVTTRQLSQTIQGEYAWVVGPESAAGMSLALTRRFPGSLYTGRVEVGASTGFLGRVARRVGKKTTARAGVKLALSGVEVDVGANRQFSDISVGGLHIIAGSQVGSLGCLFNLAPSQDSACCSGSSLRTLSCVGNCSQAAVQSGRACF